MKKRMVLIAIIIIALVAVTMIYQTFATNSGTSSNNVYTVTLGGSSEKLVIPANSNKTIIYQITNTNKGVVQYGIVYSGKNITVKVFDDSDDLVTGTIDYGESKFVKLYVENTGTSSSTLNIKAVLGYENGGSLEGTNIVPEGYEFVSKVYSSIPKGSIIEYITNLYANNNPTIITHKNVSNTKIADYYSSSSVNLMNDGLGATVTDTTALKSGTQGNIRYYGATPDNYVYFNCDDYNNQSDETCEKWRIIGVVDGKVKIIREKVLGDYRWDSISLNEAGDNNWHDSTLQVLLNNGYYNNSDGIEYYNGYSNGSYKSITINFKTDNKGIKNDKTRSMISESTWYLGGHDTSSVYANEIYGYERGDAIGANTSKTWIGKIGLIYPSDSLYASDLSVCNSTMYNYSVTSVCNDTNWLNFIGYSSFITPDSSDLTAVFYMNAQDDPVFTAGVGWGNTVFPSLYLDLELTLKNDGDGSFDDPYQIDVE